MPEHLDLDQLAALIDWARDARARLEAIGGALCVSAEGDGRLRLIASAPAVARAQPAVAKAQPAVAKAQPAVAKAQPAVARAQSIRDVPAVPAPAPAPAPPVGLVGPNDPAPRDRVGRVIWTPGLDRRVLDYRRGGMTTAEIAAEIGTSLGSVTARLLRLGRKAALPPAVAGRKSPLPQVMLRANGLVQQGWTPADCDKLVDLYNQDLALDAIAARMGRSIKSIAVKLTRLRAAGRLAPVRAGARRPVGPDVPESDQPASAAPVLEQKSEPKVAAQVAPDLVPEVAARAGFHVPAGAGLVSSLVRGADYRRAPARFMPGMTERQKAECVAAHIAALPGDGRADASVDLRLCEAIFAGQGVAAAAALVGVACADALTRFNAIVAPMRDVNARGLPIEAAAWVLPPLRLRAAGDAA